MSTINHGLGASEDAPPATKKQKKTTKLMRKYVNRAIRTQLKKVLRDQAPRPFVRHTKEEFEQCAWMRLYRDPATRRHDTALNERWLQRFRLPIDMFDEVLQRLRDAGVQDSVEARGSYSTPLEMKFMATLRWLARGEAFDTIAAPTRPAARPPATQPAPR